jgi:cell division transport system ATP-binding protein
VTKSYNGHNGESAALSDVTFQIQKGEFVFVVGASGAGKSTLVKMIYREETPTSGQVLVGGRNVSRLRHAAIPFLRRGVGVVFQDFKLLPRLTVQDNVAFVLEAVEAPARDVRRRVEWALDLVGLTSKAHSYPSELSGGEQQRVAVARAVVNSPMIILADEPTGNLDPDTAWGIVNLFADINKLGATVVVATHARNIVNAMRRRTLVLDKARLVRDMAEGVYPTER